MGDPYKMWRTIYFTDPLKWVNSAHQERVPGGEVALWTEVASYRAVEAKLWSRAAAYGGRLRNRTLGES